METQSTLASAVQRLKASFTLREKDIAPLDTLANLEVTSLAYTIDGGFDPITGNYHCGTWDLNYKIRVKYYDGKSIPPEKMLVLIPITGEEATLGMEQSNGQLLEGSF